MAESREVVDLHDSNDIVQCFEPVDSLMALKLASRAHRRRSKRRQRRLDADVAPTCRKWRPLPLSHTGFVMSLLPRRPTTFLKDGDVSEMMDWWNEAVAMPQDVQIVDDNSSCPEMTYATATCRLRDEEVVDDNCSQTGAEVELSLECRPMWESDEDVTNVDSDMDSDSWRQYAESTEEQSTRPNRPLRAKKKWRVEKARRQLKTSHCRSVCNCVHGVTLYVNHRVLKRMTMAVQSTTHRPCAVTLRQIDKEKGLEGMQNGKRQLAVVNKPRRLIQQTSALHLLYDEILSDSTSTLLYSVDTCNADRSVWLYSWLPVGFLHVVHKSHEASLTIAMA